MGKKLSKTEEINLHIDVLFVVLQRPEFKGLSVTIAWLSDFMGVTERALRARQRKYINEIRQCFDRSNLDDL